MAIHGALTKKLVCAMRGKLKQCVGTGAHASPASMNWGSSHPCQQTGPLPASARASFLPLSLCVCVRVGKAALSVLCILFPRIIRFPWQLGNTKVRQAIAEALTVWSDVTPLTFTEVQGGRADIVIDFTRYWHGDNLPFDGPGGILAHAFFPKTHREGDVHFDYDETWTIGNNLGTDLLQVAAHEFGHVLGLQHTGVSKSLMSPFYIFRYPLSLSEDDKQGIQYLYGKPKPDPTPTPAQKIHDSFICPQFVQPEACDADFDAVSTIRGELFFFKSRYVWRLRSGKLQAGYPALASRHWQGIPSSVDAAFEDSLGNIWFFQGEQGMEGLTVLL
uniref:Matrix metallopeptidase 11 n=1 Tax=Sphenodon punctatus TaxID=8508 RepID=A0A8D0GDC9_SPHPU